MAQKPPHPARKIRCFTRAIKNASFLKQRDPSTFARNRNALGFGTGVPMEILQVLHRLKPDSPELKNQAQVSEFLKKQAVPKPQGWKR
ncbi:MAG: hypothetical protein ABSC63_21120 [Candidatus Binataceae bacterium]|jgi:hypothetical protein